MKAKHVLASSAFAAATVASVGLAWDGPVQQKDQRMMRAQMKRVERATVNALLEDYLPEPKKVANMMIEKYGEPHEATSTRLIWWGNGPWKYTILTNEEIPHEFPMPHKDLLRQGIDYKVPAWKFDELLNYDGSIVIDRTPGEISARCDKEEANFLAINLAHDIASDKRTVDGARKFYAETVTALMKKMPNAEQKRYTSGFIFKVPMGNTGFKDKPPMRGG